MSMRARRLQARLLQSLPESQRSSPESRIADCPIPAPSTKAGWGFEFYGSPEFDARWRRAKVGGFADFMGDVRENSVVSLFSLPGEAVVVAGRESAGFLGAKQVAYGIDAVRNPGNDLLYMVVVLLSWVALYKLVMALRALMQKISEIAVPIDLGTSAERRRKERPGHGHAG